MFERLIAYLDSIKARDPAPRTRWEVLLYPGVWALAYHRVAHWLFEADLFFLARLVNHWSRMVTGIDIHPGAIIGRNFFIDHGFTVIGETAEIGDNVTIYQCVTLGGTNPTNGQGGKRHPTIGDDVIIGSGAQVIGPITVGRRARIGANAVVTDEVPEGATMIGLKARSTLVPAEDWVKEFCPTVRHATIRVRRAATALRSLKPNSRRCAANSMPCGLNVNPSRRSVAEPTIDGAACRRDCRSFSRSQARTGRLYA